MNLYVDTSVLVSLYINDPHSAAAQKLMASEPLIALTSLHRAEWFHAVEQHVFRGQMSIREARSVYALFEEDETGGLWASVDMPTGAFELCAELARRHGARLGVRTLDSLHVAAAIELGVERFWTFDERQKKLAAAEGLKVT